MDWPEVGPYQRDLVAGAHAAAVRADANLLVLPATVLQSEHRAFPNWILGRTSDRPLDGLILATATFLGTRGKDWLMDRLRPWTGVPLVSIGDSLPGVPSLLLENGDGFRQLLDHLFVQHGYRDPAFVGGPPESFDASARLRAYREALARHGIPAREDRILPGNFQFGGGTQAARRLLERGPLPDVIVCANDNLALGVLFELRARGVAVPRQVALTGFDDIEFSGWMDSPLTTVRQPTADIAAHAVDLILGRETPETAPRLETVIRGSCGCSVGPVADPEDRHLGQQLTQYFNDDAALHLERLLAEWTLEFQREGRFDGLVGLEASLLDALGLDWWYLCHAEPGDTSPVPRRVHLVYRDGSVYESPESGSPGPFPEHLPLVDRWTVLQIDLTAGPRSTQPFGVLLLGYRPGFRQHYELLRSRLSEAVAAMQTVKTLQKLNQALQEAGRRLEDLSMTDELTGCPNRRGFLTLGERELALCRRQKAGLWVCYLDLDGLKAINDRWGHEAGDQAIRAFAAVLKHSVRTTDLMARLGGDEFTLLASHADETAADRLRLRIDAQVASYQQTNDVPWRLAYSFGGVYTVPGEGDSLVALMARADNRLYEEKQGKRRSS